MTARPVQDPMSLVGKSAVQPLQPPVSRNFISLCGLTSTVASVARFDPVTGEKINRLRKSYASIPKQLGLLGKNRQIEHSPALGSSLSQLANFPDLEWGVQRASKAPIERGWQGVSTSEEYQNSESRQIKLASALTFVPGKLPTLPDNIEEEWSQALASDKPRPAKGKTAGPTRPNGAGSVPTPTPAGVPARVATPKATSPTSGRPQRKTAGQKRGYDDEIYMGERGYNDGVSDGNSSDDGSQHGQRKKYKGVANPSKPTAPSSYGVGGVHYR